MLVLFYLRKGIQYQTLVKCSPNDDKKVKKYVKYLYPIVDYRYYTSGGGRKDITIGGF